MLKRELKITNDGSKTLFIPEWNESYHSKHGALQEAMHVFIQNGLEQMSHLNTMNVLEFGFGTGLNALLSIIYAENTQKDIQYTTLEKFPVSESEIQSMDFGQILSEKTSDFPEQTIYDLFLKMHQVEWSNLYEISPHFKLQKIQIDFRDFVPKEEAFDIVFYDAFGMRVQPELWEEAIFDKIYNGLKPNGLFTTYACNGKTKRALKSVGFDVEKIPGPPGKREMINAWKREMRLNP